MRDFGEELSKLVSPEVKLPEADVKALLEIPPDAALGHFALPCFRLAKEWKKAPLEIAKELAEKLGKKNEVAALCEKVAAVGPYVNFTLKKGVFNLAVLNGVLLEGSKYGGCISDKPKRILMEHMNANPNKPLHLGQARNICIADSLIRMYRHLGNFVHSVNYGDDSGVNVAYNIVGHLHYNVPVEPQNKEKFDHYCGEIYTKMRQRDEKDSEFHKLRAAVSKKIEEGNNEVSHFQKKYTERCAIAQFESCWRMGVFFDLVNWETDIMHLKFFENAIERLKKTKYVHFEEGGEHAGCWVINLEKLKGFEGLLTPTAVLIKSDGTVVYVAKDIAYAMWKLGILEKEFFYMPLVEQPNGHWTWSTASSEAGSMPKKPDFGHYDLAIAVIDKRQTHEQNVVKAALQVLGYTGEGKEYLHLPYGVVYLSPRTLEHFGFTLTEEEKGEKRLPFASRKGWFITIDETLDKLKAKAYEESKARNENRGRAWLEEIAEKIAVAALRFFLTRLDKDKDLTFDIDEALDMEGETGPYLQYTHARACAILRKANEQKIDVQSIDIDERRGSLLREVKEQELLAMLAAFPERIVKASSTFSPDTVASYLIELAQCFNSFYNALPVLQSEGALREARLLLVRAVRQVLANGLELLGIHPPERM